MSSCLSGLHRTIRPQSRLTKDSRVSIVVAPSRSLAIQSGMLPAPGVWAHVPDLAPVLIEFARVLRPGGHLVISDAHPLASYLRPTLAHRPAPDGRPSLLAEYHRPLSAYLAAAIPLGFQVRHCEEPRRPRHFLDPDTAPHPLPTSMSWDLLHWCPEASAAALDDSPIAVIWHFQLDGIGKG